MGTHMKDDRATVVLQNRSVEDAAKISGILAERLVCELYNSDGKLMRLEAGVLQVVTNPILMDIIRQNIVTTQLVSHDGVWVPELRELSFERQQLVDVTNKLLLIIARAPGVAREISAHKASEIKYRRSINEPIEVLSKYYGLSASEIREIAARP